MTVDSLCSEQTSRTPSSTQTPSLPQGEPLGASSDIIHCTGRINSLTSYFRLHSGIEIKHDRRTRTTRSVRSETSIKLRRRVGRRTRRASCSRRSVSRPSSPTLPSASVSVYNSLRTGRRLLLSCPCVLLQCLRLRPIMRNLYADDGMSCCLERWLLELRRRERRGPHLRLRSPW